MKHGHIYENLQMFNTDYVGERFIGFYSRSFIPARCLYLLRELNEIKHEIRIHIMLIVIYYYLEKENDKVLKFHVNNPFYFITGESLF